MVNTSRSVRQQNNTAVIYARGVSPPFNEGHIAAARAFSEAIALSGWRVLILNYSYSTHDSHPTKRETSLPPSKEVKIPAIQRESIFGSKKFALCTLMSSILESALTPVQVVHEIGARASVAHLINCVKLPRELVRCMKETPLIIHTYQEPTSITDYLRADALIASSSKIAKNLRALSSQAVPVFTVPTPVDTQRFHPSREPSLESKRGLYLGHLSPTRVPDKMLDILRRIVEVEPKASFRLIAPVSKMNLERARQIKSICKSLNIEENVSVVVRDLTDEEKSKEFSESRFLLFAPIKECLEVIEPPLTVLEALSCGLPILATDTYSVRDLLLAGENGFVVCPNRYESLVDKALQLLTADSQQWIAWSQHSRKTAVDNFSILVASRKLANVHATVLGNDANIRKK